MTLIKVENLCKAFGKKQVLHNLTFSVEEGDHLYIVGENGSGKTTLMKLILGLLTADSGEISFFGIKQNEIGYLPQTASRAADFPATVEEVLLSGTQNGKRFFPFYSFRDRETAKNMLKKLHIEDIKNRSLSSLSGGQEQRALLARALCATKKILLLDEPLAALDPVATADFYSVLSDLRAEGITVIVISHDVSCATHYGNKILHLCDDGFFFGESREYVHSELGKRMLKGGHCCG